MKLLNLISVFTITFILVNSCQKEISTEINDGDNVGTGSLVRIQQGIDPDIYNDTVYNISYNPTEKISKIVDSLNQDSLTCTYDPSLRLTTITTPEGYDDASYTYDAAGLLTQVDFKMAGSKERFAFSYNNGVVEKKSYYSDLGGGGSPALQGYFTYTFTGENITSIKEYTKAGVFISETTLTYGSQTNPFKELGLLNNANWLGMQEIINYEAHFNKNLLTSLSTNGLQISFTYTFNSSQQVTKMVSKDAGNNFTYTWLFYYQ